jgi:hypothetical protein
MPGFWLPSEADERGEKFKEAHIGLIIRKIRGNPNQIMHSQSPALPAVAQKRRQGFDQLKNAL